MLIGWGLPTVITGLSIIVNYTTNYIGYGEILCSISHVTSIYVVFVAPVGLSILFNAAAFAVTAYVLCRACRNETKLKKREDTYYYYFRVYVSVFSITGLTWAFGLVLVYAQRFYLAIILTSTQGFIICIAFLFTRKVFSLYKQFFWLKISGILSFKRATDQSTQNTYVAVQYSNEGETVSTAVSGEITAGRVTETTLTTGHMEQREETADHQKQEEEQ